MKIAIIGAGWIGCHLALKLKNKHDITVFEKNHEIFLGSSFYNQNRLHLGFHYPRSFETRNLCKNTFENFLKDYSFLTKKIKKNLYCIPKIKSNIDYETYLKIFDDYYYERIDHNLSNISGCLNTDERFIDSKKAKKFFETELKNNIVRKKIDKKELKNLSKNFDIILDCTNNEIESIKENIFYELTISFVYEKNIETEFDSLTLVDGKLFSIFPHMDNKFTLTDVEYTPLKKFKKYSNIEKYKKTIDIKKINEIKELMEEKVTFYYPQFRDNFKYCNYFFSTKTKSINLSDSRYPVIKKNGNVISFFSGKIQGIYIIEEYVKNFLSK